MHRLNLNTSIVNHRIGLFDMILLKDNHVDFAGGIDKAITRAREYCKAKGKDLKIEIEVRNFDELQQVLDLGGVDRIMLDNFTPADTRKAVEMINGRVELESSGGITFDTLRDYAECGVATKLINFCKQEAKNRDFDRLELDVWEFNEGAMKFYDFVGFKTYREYKEMNI